MPSECNYEAKRSETERAGDVLETVREARRLRAPVPVPVRCPEYGGYTGDESREWWVVRRKGKSRKEGG